MSGSVAARASRRGMRYNGGMKILKILGIAVLGLAILCAAGLVWMAPRYSPDLPTGSAAPDVAMATLDGEPLPLASLRGKVVLLDFWSTT
jgi:cytochrome oxidase Cu insertion factor (SCO1/SenC/PrrC family)